VSAHGIEPVPTEAESRAADDAAVKVLFEARESDVFAVLGYIAELHPGVIANAVDVMQLSASMARHPAGKHRR
ncbi:hypothetical protein ACVMLG_22085, partial [Escherichia coli]